MQFSNGIEQEKYWIHIRNRKYSHTPNKNVSPEFDEPTILKTALLLASKTITQKYNIKTYSCALKVTVLSGIGTKVKAKFAALAIDRCVRKTLTTVFIQTHTVVLNK